jgi:hypothetical protein
LVPRAAEDSGGEEAEEVLVSVSSVPRTSHPRAVDFLVPDNRRCVGTNNGAGRLRKLRRTLLALYTGGIVLTMAKFNRLYMKLREKLKNAVKICAIFRRAAL